MRQTKRKHDSPQKSPHKSVKKSVVFKTSPQGKNVKTDVLFISPLSEEIERDEENKDEVNNDEDNLYEDVFSNLFISDFPEEDRKKTPYTVRDLRRSLYNRNPEKISQFESDMLLRNTDQNSPTTISLIEAEQNKKQMEQESTKLIEEAFQPIMNKVTELSDLEIDIIEIILNKLQLKEVNKYKLFDLIYNYYQNKLQGYYNIIYRSPRKTISVNKDIEQRSNELKIILSNIDKDKYNETQLYEFLQKRIDRFNQSLLKPATGGKSKKCQSKKCQSKKCQSKKCQNKKCQNKKCQNKKCQNKKSQKNRK